MHVTKQMLEAYPRDFNVDADQLATTIDALEACADACTQCADACLAESDLHELAKCIRLNMDCADLCAATGRVIARQTEYDANVSRPALEACIAVCRSCADECDRHAERMAHCSICADVCRECERACDSLLAAMA